MEKLPTVDEIETLFYTQRQVKAELLKDKEILGRFLDRNDGAIKRFPDSPGGGDHDHATCTAFCLYYLCNASLLSETGDHKLPSIISPNEASRAWKSLESAFINGHKPNEEAISNIGPLPNQYNSSIQVAGLLRVARLLGKALSQDAVEACQRAIEFLLGLVQKSRSTVPRIGNSTESEPVEPSAYLTFWACAALYEWQQFKLPTTTDHEGRVQQTIQQLAIWSERELSTAIAYHYAGLTSRFDVVELAYSALTSVRFKSTPEAHMLARHGLQILFARYFGDGCFAPSSPVLADKHNFSLQCPTVEVLALLLGPEPSLFYDDQHWESLREVFDWLRRHRQAGRLNGWYPEGEGRYGKPTAFMTTAALTFLAALTRVLDDIVAYRASEELGVPPFTEEKSLEKIAYPGTLGEVLQAHIVGPLTSKYPPAEPGALEFVSRSKRLEGVANAAPQGWRHRSGGRVIARG
jgi:hypothetical protein